MLIISDCMQVPVRSDLDVSTVDALRLHLDRIIGGGCRHVILDMNDVNFVDSAGIAMILSASRKIRKNGGLLTLSNVSEPVMHALANGCLTTFIPCTRKPTSAGPIKPLAPGAKPLHRLTIRIDRHSLEQARNRLRELLYDLPLSETEVFDMTLAAGEAMGNCVIHTPDATGFLTVAVYSDRVIIEAVDNGPGFSIDASEEPTTTLEHGRGIKIMRLMADAVDIFEKPTGDGTVARLVKLFSEAQQPVAQAAALA